MRSLIVVPVHNEGARLDVSRYIAFLQQHATRHLLFVDDGSTDNSADVLGRVQDRVGGQVHVERLAHNRGKAEAVRAGLLWAVEHEYAAAVYLDADLAAPLDTSELLLARLDDHPGLHCVIGSRIKLLGWRVERSELRHYLGRVFATAASITLDLPVYDTQCGAKALRLTPEMAVLLHEPFLSRWLFDVELIARIRDRFGAAAMREEPLPTWIDPGGSSVRLGDYLRAPWQLVKIRRRYPPNRAASRSAVPSRE
jgi:glycosyltransferase involved in cell wall biosynthesis